MKPGSSQSKKRPTQKMRNGLFSLRDVPLPSQGKTLCEDDEKNFFYSFMCEERDSANDYIYLARCRRPASMCTDRRRNHTLLQYPTTLHQRKRPPGTNCVFRVWVFISKSRLERRGSKPRRPWRAISCINQACECARYKDRGFCSPPINRTLILTEAISPL